MGERTGRIFRLGDKLRVKVARVDLDERKIDFELVDKEQKKSEKTTGHIKKLSKKLNSNRKKHPKKKIKNKLN